MKTLCSIICFPFNVIKFCFLAITLIGIAAVGLFEYFVNSINNIFNVNN